ncbi:MAG: T9SS type A sorting domain-containing protein [Crocinitomicaceae bacterium]|nr:T9SS type A sorting domain-containing protein [Crocinitomicaceae bacterium]
MKRKLLFTLLFGSSIVMAQNAPVTFETGANGSNWSWTVFENDTQTTLDVITNPFASGLNTSGKIAKFTALQTGQQWAGCESLHGSDVGTFTLNATNCVVKILVYKPVISDVGIKFATASGASMGELKVSNTLINQWEELTFDFTSYIGAPSSTNIDQLIVFPDFQARTTTNICYFDNIRFSQVGAGFNVPMVAAPGPTIPAANVTSMFSNVYTNVNVDTWQAVWSQGNVTDIQIAGNDTKKITGLDYVGIETVGANLIDLSDMLKINFNLWTPNCTSFKVKLVDFGSDAAYSGGDDVEHEITLAPSLETWNSYSLLLSDFTSLTTKNHFAQLIFSSVPSGTGIAYIDNVFFSNDQLGIEALNTNTIAIYPNPFNASFHININEADFTYHLMDASGEQIQSEYISASQYDINVEKSKPGIYFLKVQTEHSSETFKLVKN